MSGPILSIASINFANSTVSLLSLVNSKVSFFIKTTGLICLLKEKKNGVRWENGLFPYMKKIILGLL